MKKYHDHGHSYKRNFELGLAYGFRGLVHYPHGKKYGSVQPDMVLDKQLRFYIRICKQQEESDTRPGI